jgi:membrane protein implicated in regulation of membrane protease activity
VLDRWDEVTAPAQESWFNFQLLLCAAVTLASLTFGAWWIALLFAAITLVIIRLLWERPGSKVRRLSDALTNAKK